MKSYINITNPEKVTNIVERLTNKNEIISDGNSFYKWKGKIFEKIPIEELYKKIRKHYLKNWSNWTEKQWKEITSCLSRMTRIKDEDLVTPSYLIPFKDCIYNLHTRKTVPYKKEYYFTASLPYNYTDNDPVEFLQALKTMIPDPVSRDIVLSFHRYAMTSELKHQIAMVYTGKGSNGKTKFIEFMMKIMGDTAVSFDISRLTGAEKHIAIVDLKGKTLAHCSEIGGSYLKTEQMNKLKSIITDEFLSGRGAYEKSSRWINTTKFIFSANNLPILQETTDEAFFRRFKIIDFVVQFQGDNCDKEIYDRILENEAGSVLSYIARYQPIWDFFVDKYETMNFWITKSDSVANFVSTRNITEVYRNDINVLYSEYIDFCNERNVTPSSKRSFKNNIEKNGVDIINNIIDSKGFISVEDLNE